MEFLKYLLAIPPHRNHPNEMNRMSRISPAFFTFRRLAGSFTILVMAAVLAGILPSYGAKGAETAAVQALPYKCDFQEVATLPQGWTKQGNVSISATQPFQPGGHSLLLQRTLEKSDEATDADSSAFPVSPGMWDIGLAFKADLNSHDNSFRSLVELEFLDASGKKVDQVTLADVFGTKPWQPMVKRVEVPPGAVSARFHVELQKTWGEFRLADLSATFAAAAAHTDNRINRMYFVSAHPDQGHFLYPEEPHVFTVTVEATEPLPPEQLTVNCSIRDYWGAEELAPLKVELTQQPGKKDDRLVYEGKLDLSKLPLQVGKYYEIHGEIERKGSEPYRNFSAFVIEPEAIANSYKASEIPFSGRNWDGRIPEGFTMSHRLGIRIMNLWSGWDANPPYTPHAPDIELVKKFKMGGIFGTPTFSIERGDKSYDEKALREGVRNMIKTYRKDADPFIIDLGNEPPVIPERIPEDVKAYQAVYEAAKETDPTVIVLGTSIGPSDEFFKAGFGKWCDVYDFHTYEAPEVIARVLQTGYPALFKKYGNPHPVWSTEIGINSQGVSRHLVAVDMVKKFTLFFANGGVNMSWFDLFYPDKDGKDGDSSSSAHNVFDCRYVQYAPKITAVKYYDLINSIAIKKFVEQKQYGDDVHAFLFRDKENRQLQVIWKNRGSQDSFLPLPDAQGVQVIRIDGTHRELNAEGKGVTLTIGEDPLMLLYDGNAPLAEKLEAPAATLTAPSGLVLGVPTNITVHLSGATANEVSLIPPPFWQVTKEASQQDVQFTVTGPESSKVREANMIVAISNAKDKHTGELYLRPIVTGQLSAQILPVPTLSGGPAVKLVVKNNGTKSQDVTWDMSLANQIALVDGKYEAPGPVTDAHFGMASSGQATLAAGATKEFVVPLAQADSQTAYGVHATVTDPSTGRSVTHDRNVAGFVGVPKVKGKITFDGTLDSPDWKRAPVEKIDEKRQYFTFDPKIASWKGPQDLSADVRFLWDDNYLYVGVEVTDDLPGGLKDASALWQQDGLQFLIDPCRAMSENVGKYDYCCAIGKNGPQAWCDLSADARAPSGVAKNVIVSAKRKDAKTGSITYIVAFPWVRVAPFQPSVGADLGLTLILNEDDGKGRHSFMTWFGNAHTKQVDAVGDLILTP